MWVLEDRILLRHRSQGCQEEEIVFRNWAFYWRHAGSFWGKGLASACGVIVTNSFPLPGQERILRDPFYGAVWKSSAPLPLETCKIPRNPGTLETEQSIMVSENESGEYCSPPTRGQGQLSSATT